MYDVTLTYGGDNDIGDDLVVLYLEFMLSVLLIDQYY